MSDHKIATPASIISDVISISVLALGDVAERHIVSPPIAAATIDDYVLVNGGKMTSR